jgi:hypothetical protein
MKYGSVCEIVDCERTSRVPSVSILTYPDCRSVFEKEHDTESRNACLSMPRAQGRVRRRRGRNRGDSEGDGGRYGGVSSRGVDYARTSHCEKVLFSAKSKDSTLRQSSPSSSNRATDLMLSKTLKQKEMTLTLFVTVRSTAWSARR